MSLRAESGDAASRAQILQDRFRTAVDLYRSGRPGEACALARPLAREFPAAADVRRLLAMSLLAQGQDRAAAGELRTLLALAPDDVPGAITLARLLVRFGCAAEAVSVLAPLAAGAGAAVEILSAYAEALQADGQIEPALDVRERIVAALPQNGDARHNQGCVLADLGRFPEAETAVRAALARGMDAAETWLVLGRALQGQDRYDEAEAAYRKALSRAPAFAAAHRELADLVWMRTGDRDAALAALDAAIAAYPAEPALVVRKAQVLEHAGDPTAGHALLANAAAVRPDPWLEIAAAQAALSVDANRALGHALRGRDLGADGPSAVLTLCEARIACGQPEPAAALAEALLRERPYDQRALALLAVAWRLTGDPRGRALCDYDRLVGAYDLEVPPGWPDIAAYMADLAAALRGLHRLEAHPIGQSVRGGAQTQQNLLRSDHPAIRAFFQAADGPIRRHMAVLEAGSPATRRGTRGYAIAGAWSVLLQPGGRHRDHMHPQGWISSACHVELPAAVDGEGREGWLEFGRPDIPTRPVLDAEHRVKPQVGRLVLFPSYLCHATTPFSGNEPRLSLAFDVVPR